MEQPLPKNMTSKPVPFDGFVKPNPMWDGFAFAMWHPQWGGYASPCIVTFHEATEQGDTMCFEVHEFHDGEFPTEHETCQRHYCDPWQVIEFGVNVLELQVKHAGCVADREQIDSIVERLRALTE